MNIEYLEKLKEFIQFKIFIAEDVLTLFYVLCALLIPFASWYFLLWIIRRYAVLIKLFQSGRYSLILSFFLWVIRKIKFFQNKINKKVAWHSLSPTQKLKFVTLYLLIVGMTELFLRLTFEYLIAYMQMHEWMRPY